MLSAPQVVLTDYDQKDALDDTARAVDEALSPELQHRVHVFPHTWGRSVEPLLRWVYLSPCASSALADPLSQDLAVV